MNDLIKAKNEYIKFLEEKINDNAVYLHFHHMGASEEDIAKGIELRAKIKELEDDQTSL